MKEGKKSIKKGEWRGKRRGEKGKGKRKRKTR